MRKQSFLRTAIVMMILTFGVVIVAPTASAMAIKNVKAWYWSGDTIINSVARGDVDADGKIELVTGGYCSYGYMAQLCVWDGATMELKNVKTWHWVGETEINSIAIGDVDGDGKNEIVTGGYYLDTNRYDGDHDAPPFVAQLCVWDGATLALKSVKTWYLPYNSFIETVAVGDVNGDEKAEIVTGGWSNVGISGSYPLAQLCVWDGATMELKNFKTWYWVADTEVFSVAVGDVDADRKAEIITGGNSYGMAQLCVWEGATLALKNVKIWQWGNGADINSVVVGDVDGDSRNEIVTGGEYISNGWVAQLCVWDGSTLALENVKTWFWNNNTFIDSVAIGDVDGEGKVEIVTGGWYYDGTRAVAQLCVWDGATLVLENVKTWQWTSTWINSVAVGDVDGDSKVEIITGGTYNDGTRNAAQLCVWAW